jgi:hypothetical protein
MSTAFQWTCGSCTYQNVVPDRSKSVVQCKMCGQTSQLQFGPPPATPPAPIMTPPPQPTPSRPSSASIPPKTDPKKNESWTCSTCTYLNTLGNIKACVVCQAPRSSPPSSSSTPGGPPVSGTSTQKQPISTPSP